MPNFNRSSSLLVTGLLFVQVTATADDVKEVNAKAHPMDHPVGCINSTGSRLPSILSTCVAFGRSYSKRDIEHTGATSTAEALRLLDPSITVHR